VAQHILAVAQHTLAVA